MFRIFVFTMLLSCLLIAQSKEKLIDYAPGEIIIKYEKDGTRPRGSEIFSEYNEISNKIKTIIPEIKAAAYVPVYQSKINEMVNKNLTEAELNERIAVFKNQRNVSFAEKEIEFTNTLLLKTENSNENIELLVKRINDNSNLFIKEGFRIVYAEPNYIKIAYADTPDPLYNQQWAHQTTRIENAWGITQGIATIKIAIIDSGVDPNHPDLKANLLSDGYDFVDIDTMAYKKAQYITIKGEDYTTQDNNYTDFNGHGTHCAGIAAAIGDNGIGIKGVSPGCKILPLRAGFEIKRDGNSYTVLETVSIVNAINYAVNHGANVINMSFGGGHSQLEEDAIKYAYQKNVVLIASSGNSNSMNKTYPAGYDEVLAVTSIDKNKEQSTYTNYGYWTDIAAPGDTIISTVPTTGGSNTNTSGYLSLTGTSMAAPYVAGAAALVLSNNPSLKNDLVYQALLTSANPYIGSNDYIGTGLVDVYKALTNEEGCIAKISLPSINNNLFIRNELSISGKAYGKNFNRYFFEYRNYVTEGSNWIKIGSDYATKVDSGYLGKISFPAEGIYYIRLKVINSNNKEYTDVIGPITVDQKLKDKWPISTEYWMNSTPAFCDIDKDGIVETIFTNAEGKIYVIDPAGKNKTGWPVLLTNVNNVQGMAGCTSPSVCDIDDDGKEEIIIKDGQRLFVLDYLGQIKSGWPRELSWVVQGDAQLSATVIADINNDRKKEIIITFRDDEPSSGQVFVFDSLGNNLPGWPVHLPKRWTLNTTPVVCDLDGDNKNEIIIQCLDINSQTGYMYLFDQNGYILDGWPKEIVNGSRNSPIVADINNDGKSEIIACSFVGKDNKPGKLRVYAFDKSGNNISGWPTDLNDMNFGYYNINGGLSAGDINNDGYKEILIADCSYETSLWALNWKGQLLWKFTNQSFVYVMNSSPIIADINGDNKPEIIFTKYSNFNSYGKILVIDNNGNELKDLSRIVPDIIWATPSIGDIDGDNKLEMVCASRGGKIYCWDYDAPLNQSTLIWPTYQQNYYRNGVIEIKKVAPSITQLSAPINNSLNISTKVTFAWSPVDGSLKYQLQISTSNLFNSISKIVETTELNAQIDSLKNNTQYFWRVRGINNYGNGDWSEVRSITTIVSLPEKLSLIAPTHKLENTTTTLLLKWRKSSVAQKYRLQVALDSLFTKYYLNDTTITDTTKQLAGLSNKTKYYWKICAKNIAGTGPWSDIWNFSTIVPLPNIPILISPANNEKKQEFNLIHKWKKQTYASSFRFVLSTDKAVTNIIVDDSTLTDTLREIKELKEGTKYYWKVNSKNYAGKSEFSELWNFTTLMNSPDSLTITSVGKSKLKLSWKDHSSNEKGFKIERKFGLSYMLCDSVRANVVSYVDTSSLPTGSYQYRVRAYNNDAESKYSNETPSILVDLREIDAIPNEYYLSQSYPNPFNPTTMINYELPSTTYVSLTVYNVLGEVVSVLVNEMKPAGRYKAAVIGDNLASGIYFYVLRTSNFVSTKKMILMK